MAEKLKRKPGPPPRKQLVDDVNAAARAAGITPLDYMLGVIRDPGANQERRDRMAIAAAPYCHARVADAVKGKKDMQAEAAVTAGVGTVWADDLKFEGHTN